MRPCLVIVMSVLSGAGLAACVDDSSSVARYTPDGARLVTVAMADIAYRPDTLTADSGELVTFLFRNDDDVVHEAVIGSEAEQLAHETEMADMGGMDGMGGMDMGDAELPSVTVNPGQTAELTYRFGTAGPLVIGCHEPGHWEAGMRLDFDVV